MLFWDIPNYDAITRYKNVQEITMGEVKKTATKLENYILTLKFITHFYI